MVPTVTPMRLAGVACLWGLIGFVHASGASPRLMGMAVTMAVGLGVAMLQFGAEDTHWPSLLAAVLLAASPLLEQYGGLPRGQPGTETLSWLRIALIIGGLLLLARLAAGARETGGW